MTEAEWLRCDDPLAMLISLKGKSTIRKMRLVAAACCRLGWAILTEDGQEAVAVIEQFADGIVGVEVLDCAVGRANESVATTRQETGWYSAGLAVRNAGQVPIAFSEREASYAAEEIINALEREAMKEQSDPSTDSDAVRLAVARHLCGMTRDIVGTLVRPGRLNRTWRTPTVRQLAQSAYEDRTLPSGHLDPARLAVLADALEDADCTNAILLDHLRGPGPHFLGCWALDRVLGKS